MKPLFPFLLLLLVLNSCQKEDLNNEAMEDKAIQPALASALLANPTICEALVDSSTVSAPSCIWTIDSTWDETNSTWAYIQLDTCPESPLFSLNFKKEFIGLDTTTGYYRAVYKIRFHDNKTIKANVLEEGARLFTPKHIVCHPYTDAEIDYFPATNRGVYWRSRSNTKIKFEAYDPIDAEERIQKLQDFIEADPNNFEYYYWVNRWDD